MDIIEQSPIDVSAQSLSGPILLLNNIQLFLDQILSFTENQSHS